MWHLVPDRALLPEHRHRMYSDMWYNRTYKVPWHPCNVLSPPRRAPWNSTKWTLCNTSRGQNISSQISVDQRGHFVATYPWDMHPQHFHMCANVVILSLLHVPTTVPTTCRLSVHYKSFSVAPRFPCNVTPRVWPPVSIFCSECHYAFLSNSQVLPESPVLWSLRSRCSPIRYKSRHII